MFFKVVQVFFFVLECLGRVFKTKFESVFIFYKSFWKKFLAFLSSARVFSSMTWFGTDFQAFFVFCSMAQNRIPSARRNRQNSDEMNKIPFLLCSAEQFFFSENDNPRRNVDTNHGDKTKTYKISFR
jgi:hypothetical protein